MHHFHYQKGELYCEDVPLSALAKQFGSPAYVYSHETLMRHYRVFDTPFKEAGIPHIICYAMKANSNRSILELFIQSGSGLDIVSGGELYRGLEAGVDPKKVVFSGVGKTHHEIEEALDAGILMFNVESASELERLNEVALKKNTQAPVALRVNPDVDPKTHPYISTGLKKSKFGIDFQASEAVFARALELPGINLIGIDCHIGSQIIEVAPFVNALQRIKELLVKVRALGADIRYLDLGGGLGIPYDQETPPDPETYARALVEEARDLDCTLILEPGRVLVGNAGVLLTEVQYLKAHGGKQFVIVDAGMNALLRPSLYDAYQKIWPVAEPQGEEWTVDVVGPICESGDFLALDRKMPKVEEGALLAVMSSGAYGYSMASSYNSHPRPIEILVKGDQFAVIRERESYADIINGECQAHFQSYN